MNDKDNNQDRYSRQVLFKEIGVEGQKKLAQSRVVIVGCGATGSVLASLLARSGIGTLRILDRDYVEPSNLQRQTLFDENDARESVPKAIAAARQIARFNSQIVVEPHVADLVPANVDSLLGGFDLILDGTDNFETRYLINDYAIEKFRRLDLCRRRRQLRRHHEYPARRNRVPRLHLPRISSRNHRDLRDGRHSEFCREPGGIARGDRGVEVSGGCAFEDAADATFMGCLEQRASGTGGDSSAGGMPRLLAETLFIWREKAVLTLLYAAGIPCRSTSGSGRWTLPN